MTKRLQVDLTDGAYEELRTMADGRPISDIVRRALNTEAFLRDEEAKGARIIVEELDGTRRQVVRV